MSQYGISWSWKCDDPFWLNGMVMQNANKAHWDNISPSTPRLKSQLAVTIYNGSIKVCHCSKAVL